MYNFVDSMNDDKIKKNLQTYLQKNLQQNNVVVLIKLISEPNDIAKSGKSRAEVIQIAKKELNAELEPLVKAINEHGGDILDTLWSSHTVKARIPANSIEAIAQLDNVKNIDLPNRLSPE